MSVKELRIKGGLTDLRVNEDGDLVHLTIQTRGGDSSMLTSLDRADQHMLMLYLDERLRRQPMPLPPPAKKA